MGTIHVLNQFVWPDGAPTGIYAEQLADTLLARGHRVRLVGTTGHYRTQQRARPRAEVIHLPCVQFRRGALVGVFLEYLAAHRRFAQYIMSSVEPGDAVLVSTAPPSTPWLLGAIRSRNARAIYWLQDYYPELVRSVWEYPPIARRRLRARWDRTLERWDGVLKIGKNLGYHGSNVHLARNWPPFEFSSEERAANPVEPKTALYAGNFGYAHDLGSFLTTAEKLRSDGFRIRARGDGPGFARLPPWIDVGPAHVDQAAIRAGLLRAEVHLIAAHPHYQEALFPSKIWNSLAAGRRVLGTGFAGVMADELAATLACDFHRNRDLAAEAVESIIRENPPAKSAGRRD